jgi:ATP-binding cassette, subfamily B, bacterial
LLSLLRFALRCRPGITTVLLGLCLVNAALGASELVLLGLAVSAAADAVHSRSMAGAWGPVAGLSVLLVCRCLVPPLSDWITGMLVGRLNEDVTSVITGTLLASPRITALEDSAVQDKAARARGLNGIPVAHAARIAVLTLQSRLAAAGSLVLVAVFLSWWGAAIVLAALILADRVLSVAWRVEFRSWPEQAEAQRKASYLFELGMGRAAKELRVFGLASWLADSHLARWREAMSPVWDARRRTRARGLLAVAPLAGAIALLLVDLVSRVRSGHADIAAATSAAAAMIAALAGLSPQMSVAAQRGAETLKAVLALPGSIAPAGTREQCPEEVPPGPVHAVRFEDVAFRYPGQDHDVLAGLNVEIRAGESFALVGVNGAGKSTLVKLLAGVMSPTRGRITVDGADLAAMEPSQWQTRVAVVMQDFLRLPLTVAENVALGDLEPGDTALMERLAERAAFSEIVGALPRGWETPLDRNQEGGAELSGGQWQRLALVRALWAAEHGAGILVLDEPAAALDIRAEAELVQRFHELSAGQTTLTISHRFSVVRGAGRIAVLEGGRIVEEGTHEDLLGRQGRYAAMFHAQASLYLNDGDNPAKSGA